MGVFCLDEQHTGAPLPMLSCGLGQSLFPSSVLVSLSEKWEEHEVTLEQCTHWGSQLKMQIPRAFPGKVK